MAKNEKDKQKEKGKLSVSRRDFLVAGGAMIAGGALSASSLSAAAQRSGSPESRSRESVVGGGPETLRPGGRTRYGKYVSREIIGESKYPQITAPIARYDGCRGGGNAINLEWSCITKSLVMDDEPEIDNERDQFLLFYSGDIENPKEFGAEIEFSIGEKGKKQTITEPTYVYIPKGTRHGLVNFKTIRKPVCLLSYYLAPEYSTSWVPPDESKYLADLTKPRKSIFDLREDVWKERGQKPSAEKAMQPPIGSGQGAPSALSGPSILWSEIFGWPAKVSPGYSYCRKALHRPDSYLEPIHAHKQSHQVVMYLGANPLDIEDFDAELDIWLGKEHEKHTIDTCAVDHMVPGIVHMGDEVTRTGKPFFQFMFLIGPYMNNYYKAAPKDKVIFGDQAKGEVVKTPEAADYVPSTKMEDYVWHPPEKK